MADFVTWNPYSPLNDPSLITQADKEQAASCIQRAWRQSRAGIDLLRKGKTELSRLSHKEFRSLCFKKIRPLLEWGIELPARQTTVIETIKKFQKYRARIQRKLIVPLCTTVGGAGFLPKYRMVKKSKLPPGCQQFGEFHMSPQAQREFSSMTPKPPQTKDELDVLIQQLRKETDLFPWLYRAEGCFARARFLIDFLLLSGISKESLSKQYIFAPQAYRKEGVMKGWDYHVAALVTLQDGTSWVIDPSLSKTALKVEDWVAKQTIRSEKSDIRDHGYIARNRRGKIRKQFSDDYSLVFRAGPYTIISNIDFNSKTLTLNYLGSDEEETLDELALNRAKIEVRWLKHASAKMAG